jgi:methyl halide transferase
MSREECDFSLGNQGAEPLGGPPAPSGGGPGEVPDGVSRPAFWDALYARGEDGWELGAPAPPLAALLAPRAFPPGRAAVLGCGSGHDARLLAAHGHAVWGFDFSAAAISEAQRVTPAPPGPAESASRPGLTFERRDIFDLPEAYAGFFDLAWEYACFCAIEPARRTEYVTAVRRILKPGGLLAALFYPIREGSGGPPFPVSREEIRRLFEPRFAFLQTVSPRESVERRRGLEWLVVMRSRPEDP